MLKWVPQVVQKWDEGLVLENIVTENGEILFDSTKLNVHTLPGCIGFMPVFSTSEEARSAFPDAFIMPIYG